MPEPRAAASIVPLRNGPDGLEVFLLRRHVDSSVLGGAYVFPGGKLDASDSELDASVHLDRTADELHAALGEPQSDRSLGMGLFVAAIREAYEECGLLFASHQDPTVVHGLTAQALTGQGVDAQARSFNQMLHALQLRLQTRSLVLWSRWVTPLAPMITHKRFDTRFFMAAAPSGQTAGHDNKETTASVWLQPQEALKQYWDKQIDLAPPQIMLLTELSRWGEVEVALREATEMAPRLILPEPFQEGGERGMCFPGDPLHSVNQSAMPGPTRLYFHGANRRFEPRGGLEALLTAH